VTRSGLRVCRCFRTDWKAKGGITKPWSRFGSRYSKVICSSIVDSRRREAAVHGPMAEVVKIARAMRITRRGRDPITASQSLRSPRHSIHCRLLAQGVLSPRHRQWKAQLTNQRTNIGTLRKIDESVRPKRGTGCTPYSSSETWSPTQRTSQCPSNQGAAMKARPEVNASRHNCRIRLAGRLLHILYPILRARSNGSRCKMG
jgi:hypothetical protein